jgi:hypothetical protein
MLSSILIKIAENTWKDVVRGVAETMVYCAAAAIGTSVGHKIASKLHKEEEEAVIAHMAQVFAAPQQPQGEAGFTIVNNINSNNSEGGAAPVAQPMQWYVEEAQVEPELEQAVEEEE